MLLSILEAQMTVLPHVSSKIYLPSTSRSLVRSVSRKLGFDLFLAVKKEVLGEDEDEDDDERKEGNDGMMLDDRVPAKAERRGTGVEGGASSGGGNAGRPDSRSSSTMELALQTLG